MATQGWFVFRFDWLHRKPPFSEDSARRELLNKINEIPGIRFSDDVLAKRARIPFEKLINPEAMAKLKTAISWLIEQVKADSGKEG